MPSYSPTRLAGPSPAVPAPEPRALRALTFNIGAAAPVRAGAILRWLDGRDDDVIVLTETSAGRGTSLLVEGLRRRGYATFGSADAPDRGALLATRLGVADVLDLGVTLPWRAPAIVLDTSPRIAVVGVYVPSRDRTAPKVARKEAFIRSLLAGVERLPDALRRDLMLVGDYNAVPRDHVPRIGGFLPYEYEFHAELQRLGLSSAHVVRPGRSQPHSWIGRTGNGYLYDYFHLGPTLQPRVTRCAYLHGPRERRLSDHAAVAVRLGLG